jgi:23S rRNA pseudouridine1911/1915/1917 synthase
MVDPVRAGDLLIADDAPDRPPGARLLHEVPGVLLRYQDEWLAVVCKPAGLLTHPSVRQDQQALTSLLSDQPLHPVSRLDRGTSGLVLVALNGHAHHLMTRHPIEKAYFAAVHGRFTDRAGLIQAPVRRSKNSLIEREIHPDGASAKTLWRELQYFPQSDISLVRFELLSGRTHQIRLHSLAAACPLVGETLYRRAPAPGLDESDRLIGRQALHAASLKFRHPVTGQSLAFTAPLPDDFRQLLQHLYLRNRRHA